MRHNPRAKALVLSTCCELQAAFAAAGGHTVVAKPIVPRQLFALCDQVLDGVGATGNIHPDSTVIPMRNGRKLSILLAEDNVVNQKFARRLLEKSGHRVVLASDGEQALQLFREQPFDVVLMDVQMPVLGGFDATVMIRQHEEAHSLRRTPVIGLTAHALEGDRQRCLDSGMDDYLAKPFRAADLLAKIRDLTEHEHSFAEDVQHESSALGLRPVLEHV